jgi:hypothetical protein
VFLHGVMCTANAGEAVTRQLRALGTASPDQGDPAVTTPTVAGAGVEGKSADRVRATQEVAEAVDESPRDAGLVPWRDHTKADEA